MFKSSKSKAEKSKIKAVFELQFQATQVPQTKAKTLTLSVVPADVGKPTVRLAKVTVVDGACIWKNQVYETVKLIKDAKTREIDEKCYHFIVSTGSSRSGLLGQVSINFADYAEAAKPTTESLPLISFNSGEATETILHVTIQNMLDLADERSSVAESREGSWNNRLKNGDKNESGRLNALEGGFPRKSLVHHRSDTDWSPGYGSDGSLAGSPESPGENSQTARSSSFSGRPVDTLLQRQAELSELELQTLRKQVAKESKRGHDLSKQIVALKEEKEALAMECKQLKSSERHGVGDGAEGSQEAKLDEIMRKLDREKGFNNILRDRVRKAEDSNSEMVLRVSDLHKTLKVKNSELADLRSSKKAGEKGASQVLEIENEAKEVELLKKKMEDLYVEIEGNKKYRDEMEKEMEELAEDYEILRRDNENLFTKLEGNEMERLNMQNECSEYLATIQELQIQTKKLQKENKKQSLELLEYSNTILELENRVQDLEKDLEELVRGYENDLEVVTLGKIEEEQKSIRAEEALRKATSSNAIAIEHVQEELKRVSSEMSFKLDESSKLATRATLEANDLLSQKQILEEMLQKANEEIRLITERYEVKIREVSDQKDLKSKEEARVLQSEMETIKAQYNDLKQSLLEVELEKVNFQKEVSELKGDLRSKQEKITIIEEKLKSNSERARNSDTKGITSKNIKFSSDMKKGFVQRCRDLL